MSRLRLLGLAFLLIAAGRRSVAEEAAQLPYLASLKRDKVFMREGPGEDYPVEWVYHRKGLPVQVIASYDVWRRVRDMDGIIGWVHVALISRERTAVITGKDIAKARARDDADASVVADVQPGAVGRLMGCEKTACEVKFDSAEGWIDRVRLWGVHDGETF
jgi:SH3-like domain-containing protein